MFHLLSSKSTALVGCASNLAWNTSVRLYNGSSVLEDGSLFFRYNSILSIFRVQLGDSIDSAVRSNYCANVCGWLLAYSPSEKLPESNGHSRTLIRGSHGPLLLASAMLQLLLYQCDSVPRVN